MHPKSRRTSIFYYFKKKKTQTHTHTTENRTYLNFLTSNYYYFSGLVLIISVNSDLLVANANRRMKMEEIIALNKQKLLTQVKSDMNSRRLCYVRIKVCRDIGKREHRVQVRNESDLVRIKDCRQTR